MIQDLINGGFGILASILSYQNVRQAIIHNEIKGMHWYSTAFFTAWAIFQLYFYLKIEYIIFHKNLTTILLNNIFFPWHK